MKSKRFAGIVAAVAMVTSLLAFAAVGGEQERADAAVASQFTPGNIISDAVMYNGSAMTASAVQSFLQTQVSSCNSSYACLINYRQTTPSMAASSYCTAYPGGTAELASTIIAKVGAACNINQESLIVLLEKEESLVTDSSPSAGQFASATGFACPDSAPCNPAYGNFFYQVYDAARQFQVYRQNPLSFNFQAGANNNILYSPNTACGRGTVFIQNAATAGLYDYTPYQPDAAALANLYGTGDGCSSYGNRNFWRIFTDWFGSPTSGTSLVRTTANATVYLVSGSFKYPIASEVILGALSPLGAVGYVSQSYLDGYTTSHVVGRSLRGPDGTIWFYDSGIKLAFTTCAQAVDYGASCNPDGYVQLTQAQINDFYTGPNLGPVLATTAGAKYWITVGTKREILNAAAQTAAGLPAGYNVLTENAVAALGVGVPLVTDQSFVQTRATSSYSFLSGGATYSLSATAASGIGLPAGLGGTLNASSLAMLTSSGQAFTGLVRAAGATATEILVAGGRYEMAAGAAGSGALPATPVTAAFVASYPLKGTIAAGALIKSPDNGTVYVVMSNNIRPIGSWDALVALTAPGVTPNIVTVPTALISAMPKGAVALTAGTLVRSATDATVYLINGVTNKIPFGTFDVPNQAGFTTFGYAPSDQLAAYPSAPAILSYGMSCGATNYVAAAGSLHPVSAALLPLYPFAFSALDAFTCQDAHVGTAATQFIRTPDGSIYELSGGKKLPIASMARFAALGGAVGYLNVSQLFANQIPTGPLA